MESDDVVSPTGRDSAATRVGRMPTLQDVARAAGVDRSAVSYALSGKGNLSAQTRARIITRAQELGYRPNLLARSLIKQRTHTIGLVVADMTNPYYGMVAQAVQRAAYRVGYHAIIVNTDRDARLGHELLSALVARQVDGLIAMPDALHADAVRSITTAGPAVVWCLWGEGPDLAPAVDFDFVQAGRLVAEHLLHLGHRRFAFVRHGVPLASGWGGRYRGFAETLARAGYPLSPDLCRYDDATLDGGQAAALSFLARPDPPTAIFATSDLTAMGVLAAARARAARVPDDLSVVGFDDILPAAHTAPPLTTVRMDTAAIMTVATEVLVATIEGRASDAPPLFAPTLVVRDSTGPAPHAPSRRIEQRESMRNRP